MAPVVLLPALAPQFQVPPYTAQLPVKYQSLNLKIGMVCHIEKHRKLFGESARIHFPLLMCSDMSRPPQASRLLAGAASAWCRGEAATVVPGMVSGAT